MNTIDKRGILIAGSIGFLAVLGMIALRRFLNDKTYRSYYDDFHRHFGADNEDDENHGIEFLAMQ